MNFRKAFSQSLSAANGLYERVKDFARGEPPIPKAVRDYLKSDHVKQRQAEIDERVRQRVVSDVNKGIQENLDAVVQTPDFRCVKLTEGLLQKLDTCTSHYRTILSHANLEGQEFGFHLLSGDDGVFSDFVIPPQAVNPVHCDVSHHPHDDENFMRSYKLHKTSWGHSHGDIGWVALSGEDQTTMMTSVPRFYTGLEADVRIPWGDETLSFTVRHYPTIVVNNEGQRSGAKYWTYDQLVRENGISRIIQATRPDSLIQGLPIAVVDGAQPFQYSSQELTQMLLQRIKIETRRGTFRALKGFFPVNNPYGYTITPDVPPCTDRIRQLLLSQTPPVDDLESRFNGLEEDYRAKNPAEQEALSPFLTLLRDYRSKLAKE